MEFCSAFKEKCPRQTEDNAACFKRVCKKSSSFILINKNNKPDWTNPDEVYFENYEGNYHSSWQHDLSKPIKDNQYLNMEQVQEVMKKVNINSNYPMNELILTFNIVGSCIDNFNCDGYSTYLITEYKDQTYTQVAKSVIKIDKNHFLLGLLLHERIHEFINPVTLRKFMIKRNSLPPVYIGDRTVELIMNDYNSRNLQLNINNIIVNINGRYGLVLQDAGHLGNWGIESSPSSYNHVRNTLFIGKYAISVMKEAGYEFSNPINLINYFKENLNHSETATPICMMM